MSRPVILCVDDERIILSSLKAQLLNNLKSDFRIELAESAEEALEIVDELSQQQIEIPVVIADQIMAGMKGDELLSRVKELLPQTLTIMLTGQATADAVGKAVNKAGLFRYLSKPWDEDDLILTVQSALDTWTHQKKLIKQTHYQSVLNQILLLALKPLDFAQQIQEALNRLVAVPCFAPPSKGAIYFQSSSHFFEHAAANEIGAPSPDELLYFRLLASVNAEPATKTFKGSTVDSTFQEELNLNPATLPDALSYVPETSTVIPDLPAGAHYLCPVLAEHQIIGLLVIYLSGHHIHTEQIESFLSSFCHSLSGMFRLSSSNYALSQSNLKLEQHKEALEQLVQSRTEELHQSLKALEEKNQLLLQANQELAYYATTDSLTGLANRRSFFEQANRLVASSRPASVAMLDLDYFKHINDENGHQAGDTVLTTIAGVLRNSLDSKYKIGRVGGEEFAVFMPETPLDQASDLCNELLNVISSTQIPIETGEIAITGSIGLSALLPEERSIEKAINRADQALYESKHKGRNTLCVFSPPHTQSENKA